MSYQITIYNNETSLDTSIKVQDEWFGRDSEDISHDIYEMAERTNGEVKVKILGGVIANEDPEEYNKLINEK